jgi:N-acylethanolamine-hydrolysing acid amidase
MEALRYLVIDVEFVRNKIVIFTATTWVGFVGMFTGMTNNEKDGISLSLNYRWCNGYSIWTFLSFFFQYEPIEFALRNILEKGATFNEALKTLRTAPILSPCYLVLTGCNEGEGVLITRDRNDDINPLYLKDSKTGFISQTNIDHWVDKVDSKWAAGDELLKNSIERRDKSCQLLSKVNLEEKSLEEIEKDLFFVLEQYPVYNYQTVYQVIMCPKHGIYSSR